MILQQSDTVRYRHVRRDAILELKCQILEEKKSNRVNKKEKERATLCIHPFMAKLILHDRQK